MVKGPIQGLLQRQNQEDSVTDSMWEEKEKGPLASGFRDERNE